jgi:hypothetical protein
MQLLSTVFRAHVKKRYHHFDSTALSFRKPLGERGPSLLPKWHTRPKTSGTTALGRTRRLQPG